MMTLEERVADLERHLQIVTANVNQALEVKLRTEGALFYVQEMLKEEREAQQKSYPTAVNS